MVSHQRDFDLATNSLTKGKCDEIRTLHESESPEARALLGCMYKLFQILATRLLLSLCVNGQVPETRNTMMARAEPIIRSNIGLYKTP